MLSTSVIAQSVKLPISNGEYIDFNDPNNPIVNSLPIHPNSGFTSPVTDESVLYSNIVFDPTGGCPGIPGASVPLNDGNGEDRTIHNLTAIEKANLETMADEHSGMSSIKARNILCYVYDLCEDELNVDLNPIPKAAIVAGDPQKIINEAYNSSQVFPNPVKEYAEIEFDCPLLEGQATLKVYNINGKVIYQETVYGPKGKVLLDTRNWIMANYVYEIIVKDQRLTSGKITVVK